MTRGGAGQGAGGFRGGSRHLCVTAPLVAVLLGAGMCGHLSVVAVGILNRQKGCHACGQPFFVLLCPMVHPWLLYKEVCL